MRSRGGPDWVVIVTTAATLCCGGDTSPVAPTPPLWSGAEQPFLLTISAPTTLVGYIDVGGRFACTIATTATASGGAPGSYALWDHVITTWSAPGLDDQVRTEDKETLASWFGSDRIFPGATLTNELVWAWGADLPFAIYFQYHYRVCEPGDSDSACQERESRFNSVRVLCR